MNQNPKILPQFRGIIGLTLGFMAFAFLPRIHSHSVMLPTFLGIGLFFSAWIAWLIVRQKAENRSVEYSFRPIPSHWIQAALQLILIAYLATYWPLIRQHFPLIAAQLVFIYLLDILLAISLREKVILGFGNFPVIFSINFFLWFRDDWFYLQFLMVALGLLGKRYVRWEREGKKVHIFNPSGLSLIVFSLFLIVTQNTEKMSWALSIASDIFSPSVYLIIFMMGLVVQFNFSVTLMTLGTALSLYVLNQSYFFASGNYWFIDSGIPPAVFLGMHLLVTDPATTPRSSLGRLLYGIFYGIMVFALFGILDAKNIPTLYDKLLPILVLNLSVKWLDALAVKMAGGFKAFPQAVLAVSGNRVHMALWTGFFIFLSATDFIGPNHPGAQISFWERACTENKEKGCLNLLRYYQRDCRQGDAAGCNNLGARLKALPSAPVGFQGPQYAAEYFDLACRQNNFSGCLNLANEYIFNVDAKGMQLNPNLALQTLQTVCEKESQAQSCYLVGIAYFEGKGLKLDKVSSARYLEKACMAGYSQGCGQVAHMYLMGDGVVKDYAKAASGFRTACDGGDAAGCAYLGFMYRHGDGVEQSDAEAAKLFRTACELGSSEACSWLQGQN